VKSLLAFTVAAALLLGASVAHAADTPDDEEADFPALSPVVNALINADDAQELVKRADAMEDSNELQALALYLAASREDPHQLRAPYQVAALLARRGSDETLALRYLQEADERGLWFGPMLAEDADFAELRHTAVYQNVLANAQQRYRTEAAGRVGAISVLNPSPGVVKTGTCLPVVVWLHGYGINGYLDDSDQPLADAGAVLLGINGTEMIDSVDSFRWIGPGFEGTHQAVQAGLKALAARQCIDRKRVYLMGFSQGSQHAGALLAQHPQDYAGAMLVSPGGNQATPTQSKARGKRVLVINGTGEGPRNLRMSEDFRRLFGTGNEVRSRTHDGGHSYPEDWRTSFPQALRWMMGGDG